MVVGAPIGHARAHSRSLAVSGPVLLVVSIMALQALVGAPLLSEAEEGGATEPPAPSCVGCHYGTPEGDAAP